MKCEYCEKEIKNYVIKYKSWEAFNCCCKKCAIKEAKRNGIMGSEIIDVEE